MSDDSPDALNLRAYSALAGGSLDWRRDLVRLLKSQAPLDRLLRDRLAELIDNASGKGPRLELLGHKAARDRFVGVVSRHRWMEIGRWVASYESPKDSRLCAVEAAANHFGISAKVVEAAITYFNRSTLWIDRALESEAGQQLGREWVESLYHTIIVHPEMRQLNADLIAQLGLSH